jgi:hypothetical protein
LIFTESYGHRQLQFFDDPAHIRDRLLAEYYARSAGRFASRRDSGGGARSRAGADAGRGAA